MATEYFNDAWRIPNNKNQSLVSNYSMDFDGTSDFVTISNPTELTDDFTIAAWIYPTRVDDSYEMIYTQGDGTVPAYFAVQDTKLHVYITGIYQTNLGFINANEWQHVAVTRTSGVLNLYKNGVEYNGNRPTQNGTVNNNSDGVIGKWYNSSHYFKGKIDQVCIFDYALPATGTNSIATLYGGGTAVTNPMSLSPKPVSYYQLGDQSVSTGPSADYLVPNNSLQDYVFDFIPNDFIDCGDNDIFSFTNGTGTDLPFSLSAWVYMRDATGFRVITKYTTDNAPPIEWFLYTTGSGILRFRLYDVAANATIGRGYSVAITNFENQWINIVGTYNANELNSGLKIYINGSKVDDQNAGTGSGYQGMSNTDNPVRIGRMGTGYANGEFSNVSIFNTELSLAQVEAIYNNGTPNDISSLSPIAWWKLNAADTFDGTNWTIKDYAGSNDGTSSGMTSANLVQSNLQHTSGYSPYALDFGGITAHLTTYTIPAATNTVTLSAWVKRTGATGSYAGVFGVRNSGGSPDFGLCWQLCFFSTDNKIQFRTSSGAGYNYILTTVTQNDVMPDNTWTHVVGVADGTNIKIYINGVLQTDIKTQTDGTLQTPTSKILFAAQGPSGAQSFNGQLSNCARWNVGLTQAQVTEIYNQGVPNNLNNFSGTAPIGWWQLGSNSSFEGNDWTCLDEIGTDYADSGTTAMTNDDITNGPGYSANGLGTSSIEIIGDAPYSTANGISENMDVLDRTTDVPG